MQYLADIISAVCRVSPRNYHKDISTILLDRVSMTIDKNWVSNLICPFPFKRVPAGGAGQALPSPLVDALLVEEVAAGRGAGQRVLHVQQADHALLFVLPRLRVDRVQHLRHELVERTDVTHHDGGLVDEAGAATQDEPAADGQRDADEQDGREGGDCHQLPQALSAQLVELVHDVLYIHLTNPTSDPRGVSLYMRQGCVWCGLLDPYEQSYVLSICLFFEGEDDILGDGALFMFLDEEV